MEPEDTPTPPSGNQKMSGEEIRGATFPQALRGYDREAVHSLLDRVADWMEDKASEVSSATPGMHDELTKVGEMTAGILTAAEEAARNLRDEATEYADRLRADAEDESRKARLNASQRMDEMIAEAETKAQRIVDDAVARRRQLNQAISSLLERRDEIAAEAAKLAEALHHAVEELQTPDTRDDIAAGQTHPDDAAEEDSTELLVERPDEHEPDSGEFETDSHEHEPDADESKTTDEFRRPSKLLVDPDTEA